MTTPWSDTPPSEKNVEFWVQHRRTGKQSIGKSISFREWLIDSQEEFMPERYFQFGPRVLDAEDTINLTAEVERLKRENAALLEKLKPKPVVVVDWPFLPIEDEPKPD